MKLHEYQARALLDSYGVAQLRGEEAVTADEATEVARRLAADGARRFVVKAQVHAGGRGKGGGVRLTDSLDGVRRVAQQMLGMNLVTHQTGPGGVPVRKVLVVEAVDIAKEYYVGITLDRSRSMNVLMASTEGGVEIEKVAAETPEKIRKTWVDPGTGLLPFQARAVAFNLGFRGRQARAAARLVTGMYDAFTACDASLAEINPLVLTRQGQVLALDAKLTLDDNALFRHPKLAAMRDPTEDDPLEVAASGHNLNYVKLDGNVGCMVNGAGLAMATMDIIKLSGGNPANFLDVGGTASAATVEAGFRILLSDRNVRAVLVNIFGGIVRCDRVARGVVEAARNVGMSLPLIVRLQGTNAAEGRRVLEESGLALVAATHFADASKKVRRALAS